jgi:predicted hydrolase (HD superfamily)
VPPNNALHLTAALRKLRRRSQVNAGVGRTRTTGIMARGTKSERECRHQVNLKGATRVWRLLGLHGDKAVAVAI